MAIALCLGPLESRAAEDPVPVMVFQLEGSEETNALRSSMTSTIRNVVHSDEHYRLANRDSVTLSDMIVLLGCSAPNAGCLKKTAQQLDARLLVFGSVERRGDRNKVVVKLFDANEGRYVRSFGRVMSELDQSKRDFRTRIRQLLEMDTDMDTDERPAPNSKTQLEITSNVGGARVEIDGEFVGRTPVRHSGLSMGRHDIRVSHPEYRDWKTSVELGVGTRLQIRAPLSSNRETSPSSDEPVVIEETPASSEKALPDMPNDGTAPPAPDTSRVRSDGFGWHNIVPWIVMSAGVVTAGAGFTKTAEVNRASRELEQWRSDNPNDIDQCVGRECQIIQKGNRAERTQWILFGVGGGVALGGLVWGLIPPRDAKSSESSRATLRLDITPRSLSAHISW